MYRGRTIFYSYFFKSLSTKFWLFQEEYYIFIKICAKRNFFRTNISKKDVAVYLSRNAGDYVCITEKVKFNQ